MSIRISEAKWHESIEVTLKKNSLTLQVMTKAGRLFRSTSFRLTKNEAFKVAEELKKKASQMK